MYGMPTADPARVLALRTQSDPRGHRLLCTPRPPSFQKIPQLYRSLSATSNFPCIFHKHEPQAPCPHSCVQ